MFCSIGCPQWDHPLLQEATPEKVLTEPEVMELTRRFIFGDSAGAKATGLSGAATRADLGLAVYSVNR